MAVVTNKNEEIQKTITNIKLNLEIFIVLDLLILNFV